MIPVPQARLLGSAASDPGDRLCLLAGRVLGGLEVTHGHLDPEHAFAAVADEVERLRPDDLTGNCLTVSAALTRDDSSHHSSAGPANPVRKTSKLPTAARALRPIHGSATPSLQICDQGWSALPTTVGTGSGSRSCIRSQPNPRTAAAMTMRIAPSAATTRATPIRSDTTPASSSGIATAALITVKMPPKMRPRLSVSVRS